MKKTLWVLTSAHPSIMPPHDAQLLLLREASRGEYSQYECFVDAAEHPEHPFAKPLEEKELIALFFSATKLLHG